MPQTIKGLLSDNAETNTTNSICHLPRATRPVFVGRKHAIYEPPIPKGSQRCNVMKDNSSVTHQRKDPLFPNSYALNVAFFRLTHQRRQATMLRVRPVRATKGRHEVPKSTSSGTWSSRALGESVWEGCPVLSSWTGVLAGMSWTK